ncbi:hypothetical protein DB347_11810 [Opitutaceae bacterium EW11]|nr:hypothetical protein DB347_11810 [Opitutaceae bacterium EW11]
MESFRQGAVLRGPLDGVAGNWDEWYHHEASADERQAVEHAGASEAAQEEFVEWILCTWSSEANLKGNQDAARHVLQQLALLPPFASWPAMRRVRERARDGAISAVVLADPHTGQDTDVRPVTARLLPQWTDKTSSAVQTEGFEADAADVEVPRAAAASVLAGSGFAYLSLLWLAAGRRSHPAAARYLLRAGWLGIGGLVAWMLWGPDPGAQLRWFALSLLLLWLAVAGFSLALLVREISRARRIGKTWAGRLKDDLLLLQMPGRLRVKGGSAGLAFCLAAIGAAARAYPAGLSRSWIWRNLQDRMTADGATWAATGVITSDGFLQPVALEPKIQACVAHSSIQRLITPRQRAASRAPEADPRPIPPEIVRLRPAPQPELRRAPAVGYAAEASSLRIRRCRHVAEAVFSIGGFASWAQVATNVVALALSASVIAALPDLRYIIVPPAAPAVVPPSSPSPYFLWVSLDTPHPEYFQVVLESPIWANRRANVAERNGAPASVRAEIRLTRVEKSERVLDQGTVYIERRPRFLSRSYAPGERVGRYSFSYLSRLPDE